MATYDMTGGQGEGPAESGVHKLYQKSVIFDATTRVTAQNDIVQLMDIPAKTRVLRVYWEVLTVEGASRNFAIGDGSDTDGYITTTSGNSLASGCSEPVWSADATPVLVGYGCGKYYSAADTLDLLAVTSGGLTTMKLRVTAVMEDANPVATTASKAA